MNFSFSHMFPVAQSSSTNDDAFRLLENLPHCCVWTLDQRQGRGSRGRQWLAPKDCVLAVSLGCQGHLAPSPERFCFPLFAGLLVSEVLAGIGGARLALKWPNDLLLDGRKLAGILCESRQVGNRRTLVVGIGLNLRAHPSLDELPKGYAALDQLGEPMPAADIVAGLCRLWPLLMQCWIEPSALNRAWLERACVPVGTQVRVQADERRYSGEFIGLDPAGSLLVRTAAGRQVAFHRACEDFSMTAVAPDASEIQAQERQTYATGN